MADSQAPDLDAITQELAKVQDELLALPDDAFSERFALQTRQDGLRKQAAGFHEDWDAQRPTEELQVELEALRAQLATIEDQKINLAGFSGGGAASGAGLGSGLGGVQWNHGMLGAQGANSVHARIGRLKGILADRGIDSGA